MTSITMSIDRKYQKALFSVIILHHGTSLFPVRFPVVSKTEEASSTSPSGRHPNESLYLLNSYSLCQKSEGVRISF